MTELCVRILLCGLLLFFAGVFRIMDFETALKISAALVSLGSFAYLLERRNLRNSGVSGIVAALDGVITVWALSASSSIQLLGALAVAPVAYAFSRFRANGALAAPIVAAAVLAFSAFDANHLSTRDVLLQVAVVLAIGLLLTPKLSVIPEPEWEENADSPQPVLTLFGSSNDAVLHEREKYRELREAYEDLNSRSRRDRLQSAIAAALTERIHPFRALAASLAESTSARKAVVYTPAAFGNSLVVRGSFPVAMSREEPDLMPPIDVDAKSAAYDIPEQAGKALKALRQDGADFVNIPLLNAGRVVGLLVLLHENPAVLDSASRDAESHSGFIAEAVVEIGRRLDSDRRLKEAETLYELASLADGAVSRVELARRFVHEMLEATGADGLGVYALEEDRLVALASEGRNLVLIDSMSFAEGAGVAGWLATGAPDLLLFDVRADSRMPQTLAVKARIGSYFALPVMEGRAASALVVAVSDRVGGLDLGHAETLRVCTAELERAFARLSGDSNGGMVLPSEFAARLSSAPGMIVVFEPLRRDQLVERFGRSAFTHAVRRFGRHARSRLPINGSICRRGTTDLIAFLPNANHAVASRWANEMAASASMIGVRTPDGTTRIPFAVRAKVASVGQAEEALSDALEPESEAMLG